MEDIRAHFKKIYQSQLIQFDPKKFVHEKKQKIQYIKTGEALEEKDREAFLDPKKDIVNLNKSTLKIDKLLVSLLSFAFYNKIISYFLVSLETKNEILPGGYYFFTEKRYKIDGLNIIELSKILDKKFNYILLPCISMDIVEYFGIQSFQYALKQVGQVEAKAANYFGERNVCMVNVNLNRLSHAVGINVNGMLILDAIGITNAV